MGASLTPPLPGPASASTHARGGARAGQGCKPPQQRGRGWPSEAAAKPTRGGPGATPPARDVPEGGGPTALDESERPRRIVCLSIIRDHYWCRMSTPCEATERANGNRMIHNPSRLIFMFDKGRSDHGRRSVKRHEYPVRYAMHRDVNIPCPRPWGRAFCDAVLWEFIVVVIINKAPASLFNEAADVAPSTAWLRCLGTHQV